MVGAHRTLTTPAPPASLPGHTPPPGDHVKPVLKLSLAKTTITRLLHTHTIKATVRVNESATVSLRASVASHSLGSRGESQQRDGEPVRQALMRRSVAGTRRPPIGSAR